MNPFRSSENRRRRSRSESVELHAETRGGKSYLLGTLGVFCVLAALAAGAYWARHQWLYRIDSLAVRRIPIEVDGVLPIEEIRQLSGIRPGQNILSINLPAVRERLQRHPRIEDAAISVEFPETLRISIKERFPLARVTPLAGMGISASYLLDATGHVLPALQPGRAPGDVVESELALPLITGYLHHQNSNDDYRDPQLLAALHFLADFDAADISSKAQIVSIDVSEPGFLTVKTGTGASVVFLASETDFVRPLRQWNDVEAKAAEISQQTGIPRLIGSLDLSVTNHAPLRWLELADGGPTNTPPLKPSRLKPKTKRSHV
ncbi:MAG TPA: FtsQ-type POTRA domain-containing protein [Candidatus Limnocylindria bacterium]|jgi:hypothetical protein|nr:FtsQ-type POTRA domain-containing protein [Candidatus Limnocylindria bacterium]